MTSARFRYRSRGSNVAAACAAATLLAFTAPVFAQKPSLSQRVSRLEQQMQNRKDQGNVGLVNQIQDLQSQLRQEQGQIEELKHEVQQLKQSSKDQYVDLDSRLSRLESAQGGGGKAPAAAASSAAASKTHADTTASATPRPASTATTTGSAPAAASSAAAPDHATAAQDAYNAAFQALRSGHFVESAHGFRAFTQTYPSNSLAPNAYYWLGESYYITQNYKLAQTAFQTLLAKFPDSAKAPGALLKLGYCQDQLKQPGAAEATLKKVISTYPNDEVSNLARRRLQDMQIDQQQAN